MNFTADYGEAGAIDVFGPSMGLPQAVSGHNTMWWWGPGNPHATTVVAAAPGPLDADQLRRLPAPVLPAGCGWRPR